MVKKDKVWADTKCSKKAWIWLKDVLSTQAIYLPIVGHMSDTATDFLCRFKEKHRYIVDDCCLAASWF